MAAHIESHDELVVLLVLAEEDGAPLSVAEIAGRGRVPPQLVHKAVTALRRRDLADDLDGLYRFAPTDEARAEDVRNLAATYEENLLGVVRELVNQSIDRMRSTAIQRFADSFVIDIRRPPDGR